MNKVYFSGWAKISHCFVICGALWWLARYVWWFGIFSWSRRNSVQVLWGKGKTSAWLRLKHHTENALAVKQFHEISYGLKIDLNSAACSLVFGFQFIHPTIAVFCYTLAVIRQLFLRPSSTRAKRTWLKRNRGKYAPPPVLDKPRSSHTNGQLLLLRALFSPPAPTQWPQSAPSGRFRLSPLPSWHTAAQESLPPEWSKVVSIWSLDGPREREWRHLQGQSKWHMWSQPLCSREASPQMGLYK